MRRVVSLLDDLTLRLPRDLRPAIATTCSKLGSLLHALRVDRLARPLCSLASRIEPSALNDQLILVRQLAAQGQFPSAARAYKHAIAMQPTWSNVYSAGCDLARDGAFGDDFTAAAIDCIENEVIRKMMHALRSAPPIYHPSKMWLYFCVYNAFQIEAAGIESFKLTVNHNYFNWTGDAEIKVQVESLLRHLNWGADELRQLDRELVAPSESKPREFSEEKWKLYARLLALLWESASRNDRLGLLERVEEPLVGAPLGVTYRGRFITQDLCNSVNEANTIVAGAMAALSGPLHVAELGAGHGRLANILLRLSSNLRVTIIDIPPALYVSQWYLTHVFPDKVAFPFREFSTFDECRDEFARADIAFLAPHQVELLPPKQFDLFINICSLQEMTLAQIANWFVHIDRLCRGHFYMKQYKSSTNPFDHIKVDRSDYPVNPAWRTVFDKDDAQNDSLFEALYRI